MNRRLFTTLVTATCLVAIGGVVLLVKHYSRGASGSPIVRDEATRPTTNTPAHSQTDASPNNRAVTSTLESTGVTKPDLVMRLREAFAAGRQADTKTLLDEILRRKAEFSRELAQLASDESAPVGLRLLAVELLGKLKDAETLRALDAITRSTADDTLRAEAIKALGARRQAEAEARLREIASDPVDPGRALATSFLGANRDETSREVLLRTANPPSKPPEEELNATLYALRRYKDEETIDTLVEQASDADNSPRVRATALYSLGCIGDAKALDVIKANLNSKEREVRFSAVLASSRVFEESMAAGLVEQLCDAGNYPHVRKAAAASLSKHASVESLANLRDRVESTDGFGAILASEVFTARQDSASTKKLITIASHTSDTYVQKKLEAAIEDLNGGVK